MIWRTVSDRLVEALLNLTFWTSAAGFVAGFALIMMFFARCAETP
jgi:hypothetical protein